MSLLKLPSHILSTILNNLDKSNYYNISLTSRLFYKLIVKNMYDAPNLTKIEQFKSLSHTIKSSEKLSKLIRVLDLSMIVGRWDLINSMEVGDLILNLPNLKEINLCHILLNDSIISILINQYKSTLSLLNLDHCFTLTTDSLGYVGEFTNLKSLDLSYTELNDGNLTYILNNIGGSLESLSIEGCEEVTDESIKLISKFKNIQYCNLSGCYGILGDYNVGEWESIGGDTSSDED